MRALLRYFDRTTERSGWWPYLLAAFLAAFLFLCFVAFMPSDL
jgi:hypothetical protein